MRSSDVLRIARRRADLTQVELAERAGCDQAQVARWEHGVHEPTLAALRGLVEACGLDLSVEVLTGDRSLHELGADQLRLEPADRLGALMDEQDSAGAHAALELVAGTPCQAVIVGAPAAVLRGGPARPGGRTLELVADEAEDLLDALVEAGCFPAGSDDRLGGMHARERWELPDDAWDIELIRRPAGTVGFRDLARDAETLPGLPAVPVACTQDLLRIAMASPWADDRARIPELSALLDLEPAEAAGAAVGTRG